MLYVGFVVGFIFSTEAFCGRSFPLHGTGSLSVERHENCHFHVRGGNREMGYFQGYLVVRFFGRAISGKPVKLHGL